MTPVSGGDELSPETWRRALAAWAIPDEILARAPESPWGFPVDLFRRSASMTLDDPLPSPSMQRALEALPAGGTVLDVGAGAGAASLRLVPRAGKVVAVDESKDMLDAFAEAAVARQVVHEEITGRWPDVESPAPVCDVVVCSHVLYNVPDIEPFARALDLHAARRVVVELSARHPQSDLSPLWLSIHGLRRPTRPDADDAAAILTGLGFEVTVERFERPSLWQGAGMSDRVAFARKRLCVDGTHDAEIEEFLAAQPDGEARSLVTIHWDTA
jgi:SAM-dependent methyltransferase